tara:strand:+ start:6388 stop:15912 length:9525 start_codon:yes stop_codon:yes gene_type:complete
MAITFRDEKGGPLTHEELDSNFRSFFHTASFAENQLILERKDGVTFTVPVGGAAFADFQENGGSIGNVFISNHQITGSRMIVDLLKGQFYDKTKAPGTAGGTLSADEWYIDFNPTASAPYYVHFGENFAISSSGFLHASGAIIEGNITATSGQIGGFGITQDAIHGPTFLGTPTFYISGSATGSEHFISASNFSLKADGDITGSAVLFDGGKIAGWDITNSTIQKSTNIVLDASNQSISIKNSTFGSQGIQLEYNEGNPRFYVGDGTASFVNFDGTDVTIATSQLEISASNLEISSTEASMSIGAGVKLLGSTSTIEVGQSNKIKLIATEADAYIVAGTKTTFGSDDSGIIMGMDSNVPTFDLTKDANNYVRFDTTSGIDIKTDNFKLDTTYFDIDSSTQRVNVFNTASAEIIRLGEISDSASDLYGLKIFDGIGTGSANTIAMFGQQGNKIGGWEVTDSQIRTIPTAGFGGNYGENEIGLIIHSSGKLESSNFATNLKGWRIDTAGNGSAEFENMRIRGTLKTTVFEKETVNVVGGQLMVSNGTTIQALRDADGNIIAGQSTVTENAVTFSVANVSGFEEGEILKVKAVDSLGFSVEYLYVSGSKRYSEDDTLVYNTGSIDPDGLAGELYVERSFGGVVAVSASIATTTVDIDDVINTLTVSSTTDINNQDILKIGEERFKVTAIAGSTITVLRDYHDTVADSHPNGTTVYKIDTDKEFLSGLVSTARPYTEGQVLVSTGVYNEAKDISSGYILMNANPRDVSTPYMDIVERTGSGVYDLQLKSRLGDLSGLSSGYLYGNDEPGFGLYTENGFFRGAITAETGSIAGILHVATIQGGLETGQKISIGRDVSGTNDGILVNNNNYWYTDGAWKVGGANNFIALDNFTDGNLTIQTQTFSLDTANMVVSSSLNSGSITMGAAASGITETAGEGIYMDGLGKFRVGDPTTGNNYIYWDGTSLKVKGSIDITGDSTGVTQDQLNTGMATASGSAETAASASLANEVNTIADTTDTLDAKIFTDSAGRAVRPPTASATGLYITSTNLGFYDNGDWKTYMDSTGDFFLTGSDGNKLAWDAATGNLEIKGSITITGGNAATQDFVNDATESINTAQSASLALVSSSLATDFSGSNVTLAGAIQAAQLVADGKASIFKQATPPTATTIGDMWIETDQSNRIRVWDGTTWAISSDSTFDQTALINATSSSLSSSLAPNIFTDSTGKITRTPNTSSAGLYLGDTNLGFYSGSEWKTYMSNQGNFYLTGSDGNYLAWDGTSLNIAGSINITGGNAATSDEVSTAQTDAENFAATASNAAQANAATYTNSSTASLSGSLATGISASNATLADSIDTVNSASLAVSESQALVNEGLQGVIDGKNAIFRQATQPSSEVEGDIWIETDENNRVRVYTGTEWTISTDSTYDQTQLISNTSSSIALDTFTDSTGKIVSTPTPNASGLYLGNSNLGFYSGSSWKTYMADNGNFFLTGSDTNYLKWDGSGLTIAGTINIVGGNAATSDEVTTAQTAAENFASTASNAVSSSLTGSINAAAETAGAASGTASQAAQTASLALTRAPDAAGKITFAPTPTGTGLFQTATNFGFYDNGDWKTYMTSGGNFYLDGTGNNGLSWDGTDLSIDGTIIARDGTIGGVNLDSDKLYNGTGTHANANTGFYLDSSSNFSLGDKLTWDGTNLSIEGSINITNASYATTSDLDSATGSLETYSTTAAGTAVSGVTGSINAAQTTANAATGSAAAALTASATVQTNLNTATGSLQTYANTAVTNVTGSLKTYADNSVNAVTGSLQNPANYKFGPGGAQTLAAIGASPTGAGLYLAADKLGFYDDTAWKSYMDNLGNFYLTGSGSDSLIWNGTSLLIGNPGVGPTMNYTFSGSLNDDVFDHSINTIRTDSQGGTVGNLFNNDSDGWDIGFHTKALFDRNDAPVFEWDIVTGDQSPATMIGLFTENPNNPNGSDWHYNQQHHTVYFQSRDISIYEEGQHLTTLVLDTWVDDNDFSLNQQFRIRISLLPTGARYEIFKNGDFTGPAYVYDTAANGVTGRFVRPGASLHYSSLAKTVKFLSMSGGAKLGMATKISGNTIQTGTIKASNHSGTADGSGFATTGMSIDLNGGAISAKKFRITSTGDAFFAGDISGAGGTFTGTVRIGTTDLSADNTLNSNTSATDVGLENVDNSNFDSSGNIDGGNVGGWTLDSTAIYSGTKDTSGFTNGGITLNSGGSIHSENFYINTAGAAFFRGDISGANGSFSGSISAASGTFTGAVKIGQTTLDANNTLNENNPTPILFTWSGTDNIPTSTNEASADTFYFSSDRAGSARIRLKIRDAEATGTYPNYAGIQASVNGVPLNTRLSRTDIGAADNADGNYFDTVQVIAGSNTVKVWSTNGDGGFTREIEVIYTQTEDITSGSAGGWTIDSTAIYSGTKTTSGFASSTGITLASAGSIHSKEFFINTAGSASFSGVIQAAGITGSLIRGSNIEGGVITGGTLVGGSLSVPNQTTPLFSIDAAGHMTASDASITGEITATSGRFGDWVIDPLTGAFRDDNSEIVFSPEPAEIQMFNNGDKKVIISPLGELTSTEGSAASVNIDAIPSTGGTYWSNLTSTTSIPVFSYGGLFLVKATNVATKTILGPKDAATFPASAAGDYAVTLNVPSFQVKVGSHTTPTVSVAAPNYTPTTVGQTHGLALPLPAATTAELYLCAFNSSNVEIGATLIGQSLAKGSTSSYSYKVAISTSGNDELDDGVYFREDTSVDGDSNISLFNGTTKLAKNIELEDDLKVWDESTSSFVAIKPTRVKTATVQEHWVIEVGDQQLKVTPNHNFWIDGAEVIKAEDISTGITQIYVDTGESIELQTVTRRDFISEPLNVYSYIVPEKVNYIANNLINHNPSYGLSWSPASRTGVQASNTPQAAITNSVQTINISQGGTIHFRYKWVIKAISGQGVTISASNSSTFQLKTHTVGGSQTATFTSLSAYDTTLGLAVPSNFVELKAGGLQIVSDADKYVRAERLNSSATASSVILQTKGGTLATDAIRPNITSTSSTSGFDIGSTTYRYKDLYVYRVAARNNVIAFSTAGASDKRLKENVKPLVGALSKVLKLQGVSFDWKDKTLGSSIGFIAQDFEKQIPELVTETEIMSDELDDVKVINYASTVAILTEAIKELSAKVDELQRKLEDKQ